MKKNKTILLLSTVLLASALALSACSNVKEELGVGRNSPDEFTVIKRAPLTLPPDYTLRPPGEQGEAPASADAAVQAKTALLGKQTPAIEGKGDKTLLDKLGVASADPDIRKQINEDNGYIALKNQPVAEKLVFWDDTAPTDKDIPDSVVDPQKEAERLKKNKEDGKPVNEGAVPVIEKKKSTLDKIF